MPYSFHFMKNKLHLNPTAGCAWVCIRWTCRATADILGWLALLGLASARPPRNKLLACRSERHRSHAQAKEKRSRRRRWR